MRDTILIADGLAAEKTEIGELLRDDETRILEAEDGEQALALIGERLGSLKAVLLKLILPKVDGLKILETMREKGWDEEVPVLIIDRPGSVAVENKCLDRGATDFIQKPFTEKAVRQRVQLAVRSFFVSEEINAGKKNIIDAMANIAEYRNMDMKEHAKNIEAITKILACELASEFPEYGLTDRRIELISSASVLHDIGKITIPDAMLMKPGKMTKEEYEFMESHTTKGCEILEQMEGVWDKEYADTCYEICRSHHERYDGNGYPDRLTGDDIPLSAQLVSVADVYDALVNDRVYKKAYSKERSYDMIVSGECGMFNPRILDCFIKSREKIEALYPEAQ
ncbi:MAG: HD domain-containing protein [Lachnospiraceae bacterium]|nr:HD domain-containing protein [Lachnospiraceae bacterium]